MNHPSSHLDKMDQRTRTFLRRWQNVSCEIYEYSASLRGLSLRLWDETRSGCLRLGCVECRYFSGPTYWTSSAISFARVTNDSGDFFYIVWDEKAGFMMRCGTLEAAETT